MGHCPTSPELLEKGNVRTAERSRELRLVEF
jgi:hypothetical protein